MDVVVFTQSTGACALRGAVEVRFVEEVIPLGAVTPAPSAPPAVAGAVNVRGQVCAALRLDVALQRPGRGRPPLPRGHSLRSGEWLAFGPSARFGERPAFGPPARSFPPLRPGHPCLLVNSGDCRAVLSVGHIEEVTRTTGGLISSGGGDLLVTGVVDSLRGPLCLVDVDRVLRRVAEQVRLHAALVPGQPEPDPGGS